MVFSSLIFIFRFLPVFFLIYYLTPGKYRNFIILLGSIFFYGYGCFFDKFEPGYFIYFICLIFFNFISAIWIYSRKKDISKKLILALVMLVDLGGLFVFKYFDFFTGDVLGRDDLLLGLALPLGISFYTFQLITYVVDVYKGKYKPEWHFVSFSAYISMFPQLIAGPIVKYDEVRARMRKRKISITDANEGACVFCLGLGSKVILANNLYTLWNTTATIGIEYMSFAYSWLCAIALSMYIYFDFWGYSLMAKGLGRMLGFNIPDNFNAPYISKSFTEFWRRWHMTLGRFFKEYVYIPLGGSRVGKIRLVFNLFVVWALTGLWHGAAYNFIIWGLMFFVLLGIEKLFMLKIFDKIHIAGHIYTLLLIPVSWVVFTITDIKTLLIYLGNMIGIRSGEAMTGAMVIKDALVNYWWLLALGAIACTALPINLYKKFKGKFIQSIISFVIFWISIYMLCQGIDNPFLYFRF